MVEFQFNLNSLASHSPSLHSASHYTLVAACHMGVGVVGVIQTVENFQWCNKNITRAIKNTQKRVEGL